MATQESIVLCWSGGKDSALALHELRRSENVEVVELLTTVAHELERVSRMIAATRVIGIGGTRAPCTPTPPSVAPVSNR